MNPVYLLEGRIPLTVVRLCEKTKLMPEQTQSKGGTSPDERRQLMARIVVKAWTDPEFRDRLDNDADNVLREEGLEYPTGSNVHVIFLQDTKELKHFVIPAPPDVLSVDGSSLHLIAAQRLAIQLELF